MTMSIEEMKEIRDENWKKAMGAHGELRRAYMEIYYSLQSEIEDSEGSGEPDDSGMEDYLGIEDR